MVLTALSDTDDPCNVSSHGVAVKTTPRLLQREIHKQVRFSEKVPAIVSQCN